MSDSLDKYLDSGSADHFLDADQGADHFLDHGEPSTLQKVARATDMPMRGLRGLGVGAETMIEGKGAQNSLEAASEATQEGYKPKPGEKIGAFAGEIMDPRFMLFGGAGEAVATGGLAKAVVGGAAALGGTEAVEETAAGGHPTLAGTGKQAGLGAAGGAVLYGGAKAIEPVIKKMGSVLRGLLERYKGKPDVPIDDLTQYEQWLMNHSLLNRDVKEPEPLIGDMRVNQSQLREADRINRLKELDAKGVPGEGDPTRFKEIAIPEGEPETKVLKTEEGLVVPQYIPKTTNIKAGDSRMIIGSNGRELDQPHLTAMEEIRPSTGKTRFQEATILPKENRILVPESASPERPGTREIPSSPSKPPEIIPVRNVTHGEAVGRINATGEYISDQVRMGKSIEDVSSSLGIEKEEAKQIVNAYEKSKDHVVETSMLPTIDQAMQGDPQAKLTLMQKVMSNFYSAAERTPIVKEFVHRPTEASSSAANLFKRRYSDIALGRFEGHLFARENLKGLTDVERQALPFILEKKVPDAERFFHPKKEQILQVANGFLENPENFPHLKAPVEKIAGYYDEGWSLLKEHYDDIGFWEDFVNHLWEKDSTEMLPTGPGKNSLSMFNPSTKGRYIGSYAEGINKGKNPKTLDIGELLDVYDNYKVKTIANARFVDALKEMKVEGNLPAILPADKAPKDWQLIDNTVLNRKRLMSGKNGEPGVFMSQPVRISPEVAPAVRAIIDKPFASVNPGPHAGFGEKAFYHGVNAYEYVNAVTKKLKLSLSFFHHFALTETSALAGDPTAPVRVFSRAAKQILNEGGMNPGELYKAFREGHAAYDNIPLAKDAIGHGLQLGPIGDTQTTRVQKAMVDVEGALNKLPGLKLGNIVKPIRTFNEIWDKGLWDYYSAGLKLDLYERQVAKNIRKFGGQVPLEQIKRDTADFINKAAGGSFETMMTSPRFKQVMQWSLLAPDWTLGRLELFGSVFKGGVQGSMGRKFWLKAGIAYYAGVNSWNYINTKRDGLTNAEGKPGRFLWDNEEGKKMHLYIGKDPDNQRNTYILPAKAITEIVGWFQEPWKTVGKKAAPAFQMMVEAMYDKAAPGKGVVPKEDKTVGGFLKRYELPIGADQKRSLLMTFPKSYGMSKSSIINMMQRGYESQNTDMVGAAMGWAVENGYDAKTLQQIAYGNVKRNMKKSLLQ